MDCLFIKRSLGIKEIVQILEDPPEKCITTPPRKPKAGQVFLFRCEDINKQEDWRCDQYRWDNQGVARLPRKNPKVRKLYFNADTPTGSTKEFQRHAYQLLDDKSLTLVHYIGDEGAAKDFPHRGAKQQPDKPFVRTCPSYLKTCEEMCKNKKANVVYKKEVASMKCKPEHVAIQAPRNMQQLRNLRQKQLHQSRISKDDLYNLHEIAYDIPGFIWKITTYPDLICVCGLREILEELEKVVALKATSGMQLLSYDTTFQLGDFYVSPLIFRHTVFKERPCIPAMFLIHERKLKETHLEMFAESVKQIPALKKATCPLVTDREKSIISAIQTEIPSIPLVHCWNHILRDIRFWLRQHGAPATDVSVYLNDASRLFHCSTKNVYDGLLSELQKTWDATFEQYYMTNIDPDIPHSIGRWVLEELNIYNPYSGITNNQSESLNRVIKDLQSWKEAPLDCLVLALYRLQAFYSNEIKRGLAGIGEYHPLPQFAPIQPCSEVDYLPTSPPEEIVKHIRESTHVVETPKQEEPREEPQPPARNLSAEARAQLVLKSGDRISFDPKLHVFNVKGTSGVTRVVTLHPRETCSCPSTGSCYHILAAKMSLGIQVVTKPSRMNLTQLRKNTRSRKEKKSGKKRPRPKDVDQDKEDQLEGKSGGKKPCFKDTDQDFKDESFGDNSDLDLLWEILNHLDTIKAQRQAEEMPQTDNEISVPTDSYEIDQGLDSNYSPTEEAIDVGNNNDPQPKEGPANSGSLDSSISPTEDASLLQTGQTKEDAIDVGKERVTKQKVDNYWKKELELRESDKKQILEGKWLNDKHINAVNNLLQKQHPNVNGLQDPLLLYERQQWRSSCDNFVQIICVARQHFVCASNINCPPGVVDVYDSLPSYSVKSSTLRKQLAAIVRTDKSAFQVRHIAVQRQSGTTDCGLFSIAFAQALCAGVDPYLQAFDQHKMREHLYLCFEEGEILPFPLAQRSRRLTRKRIIHSSSIQVYCKCRLPWNKQDDQGTLTQCNRCKEWFHKQCENIGQDVLDIPQYVWLCSTCNKAQ